MSPEKNKEKTVLIIEDDGTYLTMLQTVLVAKGLRVIVAEDGAQGLKIALSEKPDLIVLDLMLPVMSGIEMLKKLREDQWGKDASVLILTSVEQLDNLGVAVGLGVYSYLLKKDHTIDSISDEVIKKLESK